MPASWSTRGGMWPRWFPGAAAMERPGFTRLVDRLEPGDTLVVTKLDRLGRNAMDVRQTVEALAHLGVKAKCLALGDTT